MAGSNFIDYVKIVCRSGKGGAGSCHFHRAKYVPKGGPDGGNGGRGGHIILRGNRNLWTLLHLKYQRHVFATDGQPGSECRSFGKDGEDKIIEVPCGTAVYDAEDGKFLCEITDDGQEIKLLRGGVAVLVTGISSLQRIRLQGMRNRENLLLRKLLSLS